MNRVIALGGALFLAAVSQAADDGSAYNAFDTGSSIVVGGGLSIPMLGSWERRAGGLVGYSTWRPEPKLTKRLGAHSDVVWTYYGMYHVGRDGDFSPETTFAAGFTYGYRKSWEDDSGRGFAYQLYWGALQADRGSRDLPSSLNSTPGMVFSWLRPLGAKNVNANLQYLHISNGGTVKRNRGENFFLLTLEFKLH